MSKWLDGDPFAWWQTLWIFLALPSLVMGEYFVGWDEWYGLPLMMFGVTGVTLAVARIRRRYRLVRAGFSSLWRDRRAADGMTGLRFWGIVFAVMAVLVLGWYVVLRTIGEDARYLGWTAMAFWLTSVVMGMLARPGFVPHRGCLGDKERP